MGKMIRKIVTSPKTMMIS